MEIHEQTRFVRGEEEIALEDRDIQNIQIDRALGLEKSLVVQEHDRPGHGIADPFDGISIGIQDCVFGLAEIDDIESHIGTEVGLELQAAQFGPGKIPGPDQARAAQGGAGSRINGRERIETGGQAQHEDNPQVEIVDHQSDGGGVHHRSIDPA